MRSVRSNLFGKLLVAAILVAVAAAADDLPTSYSNHTVGGPAGWFFNATTNTPSANYSSWAASQTFNLGDSLIFNSNTNMTVIQTYNKTTYRSCLIDDSLDSDTFVYGSGNKNFSEKTTIEVPLTIEGRNYYFSDAGEGSQCRHGMAFDVFVNHGLGLPPNLNQPPPPPYMEPPGPESVQPPPITTNGGSSSSGNATPMTGDRTRTGCYALILTIAVLVW